MAGSWQRDPNGKHQYRYHDGSAWTDHVADDGERSVDAYEVTASSAPPPSPTGWSSPAAPTTSAATTAAPPAPSATATSSGTTWPSSPAAPTTGWSSAGPAPSGGGTRRGWSTGAKIGAAVAVLALMAVSGIVGFLIGASTDVLESIESVVGERPGPDDVPATGSTLSSGQPTYAGVLDGPATISVVVDAQGPIDIEVTSADFDTYLVLYRPDGTIVAEDDDGGEITLSRIQTDVAPGTYVLLVDSWLSGDDVDGPISISAAIG